MPHGIYPHLPFNMKETHCNDDCHTSFLKPVYFPFSFNILISPSFSLNLLFSMAQCVYVCLLFSLFLSISFSFSHKVYIFFILNHYKNSTSLWCHWPKNLMPLWCHCVKRTHGLKGSMHVCDSVFLSLGVSFSFLVSSFRVSVLFLSQSFSFHLSQVYENFVHIYKNLISVPSLWVFYVYL